ncbi:MAG: hypothetical protein ABUT20_05895 [Bacteroidota bacterium]
MESTSLKTNRLLLIMLAMALGATLVAWQQKQKSPQKSSSPKIANTDTVPTKKTGKELKIRNLDDALENLDNINVNIDLGELNAQLSKIGPQVEKEMANVKIDVEKAMKNIDMPKIKADIDASMATIDWPKIKVDIDASVSKIDWDKMKIEMDKVKDINLDKIKLDMKNIDVELKKIKPEIEKAKAELKEYKNFVDGLDKDGLINKKEDYSIKHKNGELIINGKTQPSDVYNKYKNFLEKHKTITIEKSNDDFNIDNDDN